MEIKKVMIGDVLTVEKDQSVGEARALMSSKNIRHLPVVQEGQLVGLVSDRDLAKASNSEDPVQGHMTEALYMAFETESIEDIVRKMAHGKMGSVLIVDQEFQLCGIFTTIDALNLLADMLHNDRTDKTKAKVYFTDLRLVS